MESFDEFDLFFTDKQGRHAYRKSLQAVEVRGIAPDGMRHTIFDTQSIASGPSKAASEPTPAAADPAKVDESETRESEETSRQPPSGGMTAEEWLAEAGLPPIMTPAEGLAYLKKLGSAATSPPTTPADSPPTKSGHTTTPSAECSLPDGFSSMLDGLSPMECLQKLLRIPKLVLVLTAKDAAAPRAWIEKAEKLWSGCSEFTTQAPAEPDSEGETPT